MKGKISIVTTLYYSEQYVEQFYEACKNIIVTQFDDYEFVYVNDGSPDNSMGVAEKLANKDKNVKVIDLSRNFGHHKALLTGLSYASGDHIFMLDVDLEERPEIFHEYWKEYISEDDIDMVYGVQKGRKGRVVERVTGHLFYSLFNSLSNVKVPKNIVTARLMSRRYVHHLLRFKEQEIFIAGLCILTGFNTKSITVEKLSSSKTTYSLSSKLNLFVNGITSFSSKPLFFVFFIGAFVLGASLLCAGAILVMRIFNMITISGWASTMIVILIMSGLIIFCLGIVSIYLSKIFNEIKNRPYTIVKQILNEND